VGDTGRGGREVLLWEKRSKTMKCQRCEKPATFHITELTDADGSKSDEPKTLHLCEDHARAYLAQGGQASPAAATVANVLSKQLKLGQTAEDLAQADQQACPVCGITFYEFRNAGRLGCPYDYTVFQKDLEPLLVNIHGAREHKGKVPRRIPPSPDRQKELIELRRTMKEAIDREDYEKAGQLRDKIRQIETQTAEPSSDRPSTEPAAGSSMAGKEISEKGSSEKSSDED
jgi:protein arginine kinase activator